MAERTVEAWCCGVAAEYELGETNVEVFASKEDLEKELCCFVSDDLRCAPRRLTITIHDDVTAESRVVVKECPNSIDVEIYVDGVLKLRTFNPSTRHKLDVDSLRSIYVNALKEKEGGK